MLGVIEEEGVACARAVGWPEDIETCERIRNVLDDGVLVHILSPKRLLHATAVGSQFAGSVPSIPRPLSGGNGSPAPTIGVVDHRRQPIERGIVVSTVKKVNLSGVGNAMAQVNPQILRYIHGMKL